MNFLKPNLKTFAVTFAIAAFVFTSCKSKKAVINEQQTPPVETVEEKPAPPAPEPPKEEKPAPPAPIEKMPEFKYDNLQFEFNSSVLKTSSYQILDQIGREMKKYPDVKFHVNGHASIEGSESHNQSLSVDRANAVKSYLVNMGVNENNLIIKGFGASQPVASNETEGGRALNRRVEFKKI